MKRALILTLLCSLGALAVLLTLRNTQSSEQIASMQPRGMQFEATTSPTEELETSTPVTEELTGETDTTVPIRSVRVPASQRELAPTPGGLRVRASPATHPGEFQLYGWVKRSDTHQPLESGSVWVWIEEYSSGSSSAADAHDRADESARFDAQRVEEARVQRDGGWVLDLPHACWVESIEVDARGVRSAFGSLDGLMTQAVLPLRVVVDRPLESGALELSLTVDAGLTLEGFVFESDGKTPIEGALAVLRATHGELPGARTRRDGHFAITAIEPRYLEIGVGGFTCVVRSEGHEEQSFLVHWTAGQTELEPFEAHLRAKTP